MKSINVMNFVRDVDERLPAGSDILYRATESELALVNEYGIENTFLLQYDALCDPRYQELFRSRATERTELGLWYEIVEPLTAACGLPYRSEMGWKWDWHIVPGFSMAYTPEQRRRLIREAMRKFKEVFGCYPKTVASWLIDTETVNELVDHYEISALAICRDQTNCDAYTLVGGYFNQAYYPSRRNMFTPAQTAAMQNKVPVFRLLGPCPVHNYDDGKYCADPTLRPPYTLEPVWHNGSDPRCVDWSFKTYFQNESLGFAYAQLGQENCFGMYDLVTPLRMQIEKALRLPDVTIEKMSATGERFKKAFPHGTPATAVTALDSWDAGAELQSVYYDCRNYTANLFRAGGRIFFRSLYLFDEHVADLYLTEPCTTPANALYENLPVVDTLAWSGEEKENCGLTVDECTEPFTAEKTAEGMLRVSWSGGSVTFDEEGITVCAQKLHFHAGAPQPQIRLEDGALCYEYKGTVYALRIENASVTAAEDGGFDVVPEGRCRLCPVRGGQMQKLG
ncbi:MAG: hypothetical protein IJU18_01630 [Oscillospiraceae bacterium]|nr:hypothetical protein [Oscillospiraceae bacterium]